MLNSLVNMLWKDLTFVAFDTETTGKYPLTAEVCELAGVKWRGGEVVDTFSTLLKPSRPMSDEVIRIHGITNEMVAQAPLMAEKIGEFHAFINEAIPIAHHAPFDLGFMAFEFEKAALKLPLNPVICSSLLSRRVLPESPDHRLQTLIGHLGLERGAAHRALDDARACLQVGLRCMTRLGNVTLEKVMEAQGGDLYWDRFSIEALKANSVARALIEAIRGDELVDLIYAGGSRPGSRRKVKPQGLVRSLDGDFFVATTVGEAQSKRYLLEKTQDVIRL
jgi:DNA polymerase-3 subunit epsilon